jgi:hypothetical protein
MPHVSGLLTGVDWRRWGSHYGVFNGPANRFLFLSFYRGIAILLLDFARKRDRLAETKRTIVEWVAFEQAFFEEQFDKYYWVENYSWSLAKAASYLLTVDPALATHISVEAILTLCAHRNRGPLPSEAYTEAKMKEMFPDHAYDNPVRILYMAHMATLKIRQFIPEVTVAATEMLAHLTKIFLLVRRNQID